MPAAQETKPHIIRSAIAVLKAVGTEGLTMRKVAGEAEMSLGNLQYHFKDRTSLLAGLAEYYFGECSGLLDKYQHEPEDGSNEEKLHHFISSLLDHVDHVDHVSDMCRMFREIWALSTRDEEIHRQMVDYYQTYAGHLIRLIHPLSGSEDSAKDITQLLLPYIEGYSIAFEALPRGKEETADLLTGLGVGLFE